MIATAVVLSALAQLGGRATTGRLAEAIYGRRAYYFALDEALDALEARGIVVTSYQGWLRPQTGRVGGSRRVVRLAA